MALIFCRENRYSGAGSRSIIQGQRRRLAATALTGDPKVDIESAYLDAVLSHLRQSENRKNLRLCAIFSVMGPPGAGKTTLIKRLQQSVKAQRAAFYVEDASANPHLTSGFGMGGNFNADRSQCWFLNQYAAFFQGCEGQTKIFLDQDPCAVGLVYSRCLQAINVLTEGSYFNHLKSLLDIERTMSEISACRKIIALDAPADVLVDRLRNREPGIPISDGWIADLNSGFRSLYSRLEDVGTSNFVRLDSLALSEEAIEAEALRTTGLMD